MAATQWRSRLGRLASEVPAAAPSHVIGGAWPTRTPNDPRGPDWGGADRPLSAGREVVTSFRHIRRPIRHLT